MKVLLGFMLIACLASCGKDAGYNKISGTFVDALTKRDTIILAYNIFPEGSFSYKPYHWQDSALNATYFFFCKSYFELDTIGVLSMLSSSTNYIKAYFRPEAANKAFVIDDFYHWRTQTRSKIRYVRIR